MHIERIHKMIECLTEKALCELDKGIENVNTEEMGEAVDMIKDLCEAEYKAVIVKSMKKADEEEEEYDKELLRSLKAEYGEESGRRYSASARSFIISTTSPISEVSTFSTPFSSSLTAFSVRHSCILCILSMCILSPPNQFDLL